MLLKSYADFLEHLVRKNCAPEDAGAALTEPDPHGSRSPLRRLHEITGLSGDEFADEVAAFRAIPRVELPLLLSATSYVERFTHRFLRDAMVFPYRAENGDAVLAMGDPLNQSAMRAAEIVLGTPVLVVVASFDDINTALNERLGHAQAPAEAPQSGPSPSIDDIESLRDLASGAPVVRAVNELFEKAVDLRASDIHVEPFRTGLVVRMRVDGLLRPVPTPAGAMPQAVISRIKILAGLNIAERRLPQDGAARVRIGASEIDVRVATMPTQHGESAVMRLLAKDRGLLDIGSLGLRAPDEKQLSGLLRLPHGMIIVTGPTGSGKTTTLATMLSILNEPGRKILTIEDPVEYEIPGINQSQVKPGIGLTFATALRSFVRQDPDVIMVGEVRDTETAHIAVHAALTGHLVLTTLHTETAAAAIPRLLDLGVEGFLIKSTLRAVIAQRLVRVLCERCKTERILAEDDFVADPRYAALGLHAGETLHEPGRCERCGGVGYRGRKGVFEILELTPPVRDLIGPKTDGSAVEKAALHAGMTTMVDDAIAKCRTGMTSVAEVLRVTTAR